MVSPARDAEDRRGAASAERGALSAERGTDLPRRAAGHWDFGDGFLSFMAGEMIPDSGGKVNENMLRTEFSRHGLFTSLLVLVPFSFSPNLPLLEIALVRN